MTALAKCISRHHLSKNRVLHFEAKMGESFTSSETVDNDVVSDAVIDSLRALAARAAVDAMAGFHVSMPPSLLAENVIDEQDCAAPFAYEECRLGPLLGSGEFSDVFEVKSFCVGNQVLNNQWTDEEMDQRLAMKRKEKYRQTKKSRYALKRIKPAFLETSHGRREFVQAVRDLAVEKEFLMNVSHPNIIKLRGITDSGPTGFALVIDCLVETLDQRVKRWRSEQRSNLRMSMKALSASFTSKFRQPHEGGSSRRLTRSFTNPTGSFSSSKTKSRSRTADEVMDDRLGIAFQITAALVYLHSHGVIFRDLKPCNIGFDVRGDAKIFDFGLARFCPEGGDPNVDKFSMSGAGTPRYMAPEVLSGSEYNLKADVYSFAIILWEMLSGQTPYGFARNRHSLVEHVVKEHVRPDIDPCWPAGVQIMLETSFDADIGKRPEMKSVYNEIREVLVSLRDGDRTGLDDMNVSRRRSAISAHGADE